jgi:hypothetical protein
MNLQLFQSKNSWVDKSSMVSFKDIYLFQKNGSNLLQKVNYSDFENLVTFQAQQALREEDYSVFYKKKHLLFPFLKDRKKLTHYINIGVYDLPKTTLSEEDFINVNVLDMSILSRSIDKGLYGMIKTMLPCYTTCYFGKSGGKGKDNVVGHSGLLPLDIDNDLTDEQIESLKKMGVYALTPSTGGNVRPIFRIVIDDKSISRAGSLSKLHELYFDLFNIKLKELNIQIDLACRNINRLFYISKNEEFKYFYLNEEAYEFTLPKNLEILKSSNELLKSEYKSLIDNLPEYFGDNEQSNEEILYIIRKELEEIFTLCLNNNIQPFYNEGSMYYTLRDFQYSLKDYLTEEELTHWLCKFLTLSKLDKRIIKEEYINRGIDYIKNNIIK